MKVVLAVEHYREQHNVNRTDDFKAGFNECFALFEIGLKREGIYNQGMLLTEKEKLEKEVRELKTKITEKNAEIEKLKIIMNNQKEFIPEVKEQTKKKYSKFIQSRGLQREFSIYCNTKNCIKTEK